MDEREIESLLLGAAPASTSAPAEGGTPSEADIEKLIMGAKAEKPKRTDQRGYGGKLNAQLVSGMPIIGPLMDKAVAATGAAITPAINPVRQFFGKQPLPGVGEGTFGERYSNNLMMQRADDAAFAQENPIASGAANVVGGSMVLGPAARTVMGAKALGMTGTLPMRIVSGGVGGGGIGATDAALRGDDVGKGAVVGGAFGLGAPVAGQIIGSGVNKLLNTVVPQRVAGNRVLESLGGSQALPEVQATLASNPRLAMMDVEPNAQLLAQGIATQPGKGRAILDTARADRAASAGQAIEGAYDSALGGVPDVRKLVEGLKTEAKTNAEKGFGAALNNAKPVNLAPVLSHIDDVVRPGVMKVSQNQTNIPLSQPQQALARIREMLTDGENTLTDPWRLHGLQQQLRVEADTLAKSTSGQDKLTANALRDVRSKLNDAIDRAAGGKFKPAQKQFADDMSVQDAFEKGRSIFNNSKTDLENRPEYWRAAFDDASEAEKKALRVGARVAVDQEINAARNANRRGTAIPETGFNADKLRIILGDTETARLMNILSDEHTIANTNNALFAGSQTQPRAQAAKATAIRDVPPLGAGGWGVPMAAEMIGNSFGQPGVGIPFAAMAAARKGYQVAGRALDVKRNEHLARILSASGPEADAAINMLLDIANRSPATRAQLAKGTNMLIQAGGSAARMQAER